jgi:putative ABC transport system substrate-binding protein
LKRAAVRITNQNDAGSFSNFEEMAWPVRYSERKTQLDMNHYSRCAVAILVRAAILLLLLNPFFGSTARAADRAWRMGFLSVAPRDSFHDAFFKGLSELGYTEGRDFSVVWRIAAANEKRLTEAAAHLAKAGVDVIVARGTQATFAAKKATSKIPIVMTGSSDPVGTGLVRSLAHPGGNVTGMSIVAPELAQKRLELLRRVVPASRVAVLWNPLNAGNLNEWKQTRAAAGKLRMTLLSQEVRQPKDIHRAFKSLNAQHTDAVITLSDAVLSSGRTEIVHLAANSRLPGMFHLREFVEQGGLMSYGPDLQHSFYRAAHYVDRILRGADPSTMPVEQPVKFDLMVNLQTAKQLGISVPTDILALAEKVIR